MNTAAPLAAEQATGDPSPRKEDATLRLKHLIESKTPLESIGPDETLKKASSQLALSNVPLLAVLKSPRAPVGVIGWQHLVKAQLTASVSECVGDHAQVVPIQQSEDSLLDVLPLIEKHGAILVLGADRTVIALFTAADASAALHRRTVPFLLLDEIEKWLRILIDARLPDALHTIARGEDPPTFGSYLRVLENPDHWGKFAPNLERSLVVTHLDGVRQIRNRCMHFAPGGVTAKEVDELHKFLKFLRMIGGE